MALGHGAIGSTNSRNMGGCRRFSSGGMDGLTVTVRGESFMKWAIALVCWC